MSNEEDQGIGAIDRIYEILEMLDDDIRALDGVRHKSVDVFRYQGIYEAVEFLGEFSMSNRLGLSDMDLYKFQRMSGTIDSSVLWQLSGRLKGLLREAEGTIRTIASLPAVSVPVPPSRVSTAEAPVQVITIGWVRNDRDRNAELIADLTQLLDEAVSRARGTNLPPEKAAFSEFQRKALIDLLETAVLMLKGPMIEKGLLSKLGTAAGEGAASAVKKGAEVGLGIVLKRAWDLIVELLKQL